MQSVSAAFKVDLAPHDLALLCQKVENLIAGAPCGVMDQMASVFGRSDSLMALLCQPAQLHPPVSVPAELAFWGLDSGERHDVGGTAYRLVRTAAFMGYQMIAGSPDPWGGYLANLSPAEFERHFATRLPEEIVGEKFLAQYSGTLDTATRVDPASIYKVRQATAHPVYEHQRVCAFRDLLHDAKTEDHWTSLGRLMYQSHASYSACGLGSRGTDTIVELVRAEGAAEGLYGARITGGGGGGTVAILGRADAGPVVMRIRDRYRDITGYTPIMFSGASNGAANFGSLTLNL
jgi:L-arabinokinase